MSTARPGESPLLPYLLDEMPPGPVLNLGAGGTSAVAASRFVINVDHVAPSAGRVPGQFVVADAHDLPFKAGSFVGVVAKDVLEHVDSPVDVLTELGRTCRPGARLVAIVPRAIARAVWDDPTHVRGFTQRALESAFGLAGWKVAAPIRRLGGFPGAGRLGLTPRLETVMRIPGLGHWYGRNWIARAILDPAPNSS